MNYKLIKNSIITSIIIFIIGIVLLILSQNTSSIIERSIEFLVMLISISIALLIYILTLREKEKQRLIDEINIINIALKEIEKNNQWCAEYISQGTNNSIKFYNLTKIGVERCLNNLKFLKDNEFLEAFYMSLKLIGIVNNIIGANIITGKNFNSNLVSMSKESINEANILKAQLVCRIKINNKEIRLI